MAQAVIFPKLGQTMEEGAIVKWLKKVGDPVAKGDILFEIETDKANLEVESFFEGVLLKIYVKEGITVPVNTLVGYVGAAGEKVPDTAPKAAIAPVPSPVAVAAAPAAPAAPAAVAAKPAAPLPVAAPAPQKASAPVVPVLAEAPVVERLVISPRAKALAKDACINPARIRGTGPNGRIVEKDVQDYLEKSGYHALRVTPAAKRLASAHEVDLLTVRASGDGGRVMVEDVERMLKQKPVVMSRIRQVIARRLVESKQTIPHFYVTVKADITDLMTYRSELKAKGINYSVNDFVLEAVILSLTEFPVVNSVTDGATVAWRGDVDLGMAVSIDTGLVVPVIKAAQTLTMKELNAQTKVLAEKARAGKLTPDEMTGSSFTVSNMGMLNIDQFTAIINPGEAGILAVSSARQVPAVVNGEIKIRTVMAMTLSADHRIVDGSMGAQFVNAIRSKLESLELWKSLV
jgi:pyruvate dehydrogenase E2 component (dihydrolipoamide acetyltransferase)